MTEINFKTTRQHVKKYRFKQHTRPVLGKKLNQNQMYHIGEHMSEKRILKVFLVRNEQKQTGKTLSISNTPRGSLRFHLTEKLSKKCDLLISNVFAAVKKSYHFQTQIRSLV